MAALDIIAPEARERVVGLGRADIVVALPSCQSMVLLDAALAVLRPALSAALPDRKIVILHPEKASPVTPADEPQSADSQCQLLPCPLPPVGRFHDQSLELALRSLFQVGTTLGVHAFVLLGSEGTTIADDLRALAEPVLNQGYDLAVPMYARRKFTNLVNSSIVYPFTRALYGARLSYPMAIDLAVSAKLADRHLQAAAPNHTQSGWITTQAVAAGFQFCQVHRDAAPAPTAAEPADLSTSLAQVLSTLFLDAERNAAFWQKVRGSQPVRTFGQSLPADYESASADVHNMVQTFQRGCSDLLEIWAQALSPATLVELRKLAKSPVDQFRLADDVWVHVIYDFMLGHRQRVISREHLLRAMTPIYLGWVASYALEVQNAAPNAVDDRLEKLCVSFESLKPYLLSRWRWPDRFNP